MSASNFASDEVDIVACASVVAAGRVDREFIDHHVMRQGQPPAFDEDTRECGAQSTRSAGDEDARQIRVNHGAGCVKKTSSQVGAPEFVDQLQPLLLRTSIPESGAQT